MTQPTAELLLRQIRNRLTLACVALFSVLAFVMVPELHRLPIAMRIALFAVPLCMRGTSSGCET